MIGEAIEEKNTLADDNDPKPIAVQYLETTINEGYSIEIPILGIKIKPEKKSRPQRGRLWVKPRE